jgi:hypothetical protein
MKTPSDDANFVERIRLILAAAWQYSTSDIIDDIAVMLVTHARFDM